MVAKTSMREKPYHSSVIWQYADRFVFEVYRATETFPSHEKYNVISQLRRAALSVPLNIVEGQAKGSTKDFVRFLMIARGSLAECSYLLEFSKKMEYMSEETHKRLEKLHYDVSVPLQRSISSLKEKMAGRRQSQPPNPQTTTS